jgi:3-dehydroquinate synthase
VGTHREILDAVGLPRTYRRDAWPSLREAMSLDKKTRGSTLRFVVLEGLQKPTIWRAPEPEVLIAAYNAISA